MGAKNSRGTFNRQAEARQSQKKTYKKFQQSITKLTKDVNKVKIQNKEKLLELEIAIKSATNDLEIAKTYMEPKFEDVYVDFLKNCEELDQIVKNKLQENDKSLQNTGLIEEQENIDESLVNNRLLDIENAIFAEDVSPPDVKKKNKKSKKDLESTEKKSTKKEKKNKNKELLEVNSLVNEENVHQNVVEDAVPSKKDKKNRDSKQVDDQVSRDTINDVDKPNNSLKKRFWSFPMRIKRNPSTATSIPDTLEPIIIIQDPDNEDRSLQNIEINQLQKAIKTINTKAKTKRQSKAQSQFFDQQSGEVAAVPDTPLSTPTNRNQQIPEHPIQQQDSLQQIHNIRMSISTLEEMTNIYTLTKRGNFDYIYDNLYLCVNQLKDMEQDSHSGMLTLRHEKKLAMEQAQECLDVLEGKIALPDSFDKRKSSQDNQRVSGGFPQVVIARTPSKKRENSYQKSVEFIDITNNDEIIDFSLGNNKETQEKANNVTNINRELEELENISRASTDFSEDDDLKDILMSLQDSTEEISQEKAPTNKAVLITSF